MTLSRTVLTLAALSLLAVALEVFLVGEGDHGAEPSFYFTGLYALISIGAAIVMTVGVKLVGRLWLERHEDYYD
ncbi:MAG: hypothetical protein C1O27_001644 [Chloroflexi bacterium]|nr:MAG: hypothetical protein C1O27_001644 [Chloroflexota bacterium]